MYHETSVEQQEYGGWKNCVRLSNGLIDLFATTDVGPRIIRFGFIGKQNELLENPDDLGTTGGDKFRAYGGHRMWHAPESHPRTYMPDNQPVGWTEVKNGIILSQDEESWTHIKKELEISMSPSTAEIQLRHRMINNSAWSIELAIWAITLMSPGGVQILPQGTRDTGVLPNRMICLWPYSKMNDARVCWGEKYTTLKQDGSNNDRFKFGFLNQAGWAAYSNQEHLFVKQFTHYSDTVYPDFHAASYEAFTSHYIMEMESLSPLRKIAPGEAIEHLETWKLYQSIQTPQNEAEIKLLEQNFILENE